MMIWQWIPNTCTRGRPAVARVHVAILWSSFTNFNKWNDYECFQNFGLMDPSIYSPNIGYQDSTGFSFMIWAQKVMCARGFASFIHFYYFKKTCFLLPRITPCSCRWRSVRWWATVAYYGTANAERTSTRRTLSWGEKPGILWEHVCHILIAPPIVSQTMPERAVSHK